nr:copia protein [Tanacetum cinerariifolium]
MDDDLDEEEAIKVAEKKNLKNDIKDETLEIDEVVIIKESRNHPLQNVIGNVNQRTLRNKLDENGIVSQNKARLVAKGYNQQEGIDYDETYASIARVESIRILLAYAYALDFKLFQMDVKSAFLNGFINEEGSGIEIIVYADSDHAGDYVDRKSTSSTCTFVGCCLKSWFLKKQTDLAISTTEAEYVSARKACQQALWMKQAFIDYDVRLDDVPIISSGNLIEFEAFVVFVALWIVAVCGGFEVVLLRREEFCLVTGLRFGIENLAESNDCVEGKRRILDWMLRYPRVPAWKKGKFMGTMVHGFFHGNMHAARLTPNETEARSDRWISSRAYFVCEDMKVELARQANKRPIIVSQHYGISDLSKFPSMQTHPNSNSLFNIGTPTNRQTPMTSQPGSSNWQRQMPAHSATPFWQPAIPSHPGTYNYKSPIPSHMGNPNLQPSIGRHYDVVGLFDQVTGVIDLPNSDVYVFMSFKPDIPDTPVYKSKPMISKQYSQQSEVKKGQNFDNKEALVLAVRLKALNDSF